VTPYFALSLSNFWSFLFAFAKCALIPPTNRSYFAESIAAVANENWKKRAGPMPEN